MSMFKKSNHGSQLVNGQKVRELRCQFGLTQLELAMKIDCSERLIRKMEKGRSVSAKSLFFLCDFFRTQNIEIDFDDLVLSQSNALEVAKQWFDERFLARSHRADQKWFSQSLSLSQSTVSKLKIIEQITEASTVSIGATVERDQTVALNFHFGHTETALKDPSGCVWVRIERQEISELCVILDTHSGLVASDKTEHVLANIS